MLKGREVMRKEETLPPIKSSSSRLINLSLETNKSTIKILRTWWTTSCNLKVKRKRSQRNVKDKKRNQTRRKQKLCKTSIRCNAKCNPSLRPASPKVAYLKNLNLEMEASQRVGLQTVQHLLGQVKVLPLQKQRLAKILNTSSSRLSAMSSWLHLRVIVKRLTAGWKYQSSQVMNSLRLRWMPSLRS